MQRAEVSEKKLLAESAWSSRNFPYISTVHVGAFVLMASEIILAADSPMGFPWRLIWCRPWFSDSAEATNMAPSIPSEFSWRLDREEMENHGESSGQKRHKEMRMA